MNRNEIKVNNNLIKPTLIKEIESNLTSLENAVFDLEQKTDLGESNSIPLYIEELDVLFKRLKCQVDYHEVDDQSYNDLMKKYGNLRNRCGYE